MMIRYSRQQILSEIEEEGQEQLLKSKVLIVGLGALGGIIANNLVRAGIGSITLVDRDIVELENLQRQILYDESDVGIPKAISAGNRLKKINSEIEIVSEVKDVNYTNVESLIENKDLILDGTDNMETRFLINDACIKHGVPWIYGGAISTYGMCMNIVGKRCFRCLYPSIPKAGAIPTCDTVGVLNTIPVIIGSIQSTEAIKILVGSEMSRELIIYDAWREEFRKVSVKQSRDCRCCVKREFEFLEEKRELITALCGRDAVHITPAKKVELDLEEMMDRLIKVGDVKLNNFVLKFRVENYEILLFKDARAIIKGTEDVKVARSVYSRYIGV